MSLVPVLFALGAIALEGVSRVLGFVDFKTNLGQHVAWKMSKTTKAVANDEIRALYQLEPEAAFVEEPRNKRAHQAAAS